MSGFDWSGEKHAFTDVVTVYACVSPKAGGQMSLTPLARVSVEPAVQEISTGGNGVLPFRLRVQPGAEGVLQLQRRVGGVIVGPQTKGPTIVTDEQHWHFVSSS